MSITQIPNLETQIYSVANKAGVGHDSRLKRQIIIGRITSSEAYPEIASLFETTEAWPTERRGHGTELAEKACSLEDISVLTCNRGDGTINEMANGILKAKANGHIPPPLLILPFGTGNDLAKSLGILTEFESYSALQHWNVCSIDVGKATFNNFEGKRESRYYVNFAGVGFDAQICQLHSKFFRRAGPFSYLLSTIVSLCTYSPREMNITVDTVDGPKTIEGKFYFDNLGNGIFGGGGFNLSPYARMDDQQLDHLTAGNVNLFEAFGLISSFKKGTHLNHSRIGYKKTNKVEIESRDHRSIYVHLDGEVVGVLLKGLPPVVFEMIPSALDVFYYRNAPAVKAGNRS